MDVGRPRPAEEVFTMRRTTLGYLPAVLAAGLISVSASAGTAEPVQFETADQVELRGEFYPGTKSRKSPCVLLLPDVGPESNAEHSAERWGQLAEALQKRGYAVLRFDFRGHGGSTTVGPGFWDFPVNRTQARSGYSSAPKDRIRVQDFERSYYPVLANDVAAARLFLDHKNDVGECNTSDLIVVGAGEGATLGALWLAAESCRYRVLGIPPRRRTDPEGDDVACAVWLSLSPTLAGRRMPVSNWLLLASRDRELPTAFLYGDHDTAGAEFARRCLRALKAGRRDLEQTGDRAVVRTDAAGEGLLRESLETGRLIDNYLDNVLEERLNAGWEEREPGDSESAWFIPGSSPVPAKLSNRRTLLPVPLARLGVR
jgi:hypothetical protein